MSKNKLLIKPTKVTFVHRGSTYIKSKPTLRGACESCYFHSKDVATAVIQEDDPCRECTFKPNVNNYMNFVWKKFSFMQKLKFFISKIRYFLYNLFK